MLKFVGIKFFNVILKNYLFVKNLSKIDILGQYLKVLIDFNTIKKNLPIFNKLKRKMS